MANIRVFSRSNVTGNPYLWRPTPSNYNQKTPAAGTLTQELTCDSVNDFKTTYVTKRIWIVQSGSWSAPLYVKCNYVE